MSKTISYPREEKSPANNNCKSIIRLLLLSTFFLIALAASQHTTADAQKPQPQSPSQCRDSRGRYASCGASDWFDAVPSLRIPSISINLGRIIPSVSIGSPIKWGFKVPISYTPRVKFMKFQVYFDPDFDYFTANKGWVSIAAFKAAGNMATTKVESRAGSHKYRVISPTGGGFDSYISPSTRKKTKAIPTTGTFSVNPNPVIEDQKIKLEVQLDDRKTARQIFLLSKSTCDQSEPWLRGSGPANSWKVLGQFNSANRFDSDHVEIRRLSADEWIVDDDSSEWNLAQNVRPISGITSQGQWSFSTALQANDNGRCFVAIAPASGNRSIWVSKPTTIAVSKRNNTVITTTQTTYSATNGSDLVITGNVSGGSRQVIANWCTYSAFQALQQTSSSNGDFLFTLPVNQVAGNRDICFHAPQTASANASYASVQVTVARQIQSGTISISSSAISTGQQFTLSGTTSPVAARTRLWIRAYCAGNTNYPSGWAAQTWASSVFDGTGRPTGWVGLNVIDNYPGTASILTDINGDFSVTFTSTISLTCIYGVYSKQTDYLTAWLSNPSAIITVS